MYLYTSKLLNILFGEKKPMHLCLSNQYQHFTYAICFSDKSKTNQTNTVKKLTRKNTKTKVHICRKQRILSKGLHVLSPCFNLDSEYIIGS